MAALSKEEIAHRIAAGEAIRQERAKKRELMEKAKEKENILAQSLVSVDAYHKGLKQRVAEACNYLHKVIYQREALEVRRIPEIADLFSFRDEMDLRVAYKMCREDYCRLMGYCWHFQHGKSALLGQSAFGFWNKVLTYPEVDVSGSLILGILADGQIGDHVYVILRDHFSKFVEAGMREVLFHTCKRMLKNGGMVHVITGEVKVWNERQTEILCEIAKLYENRDLRILEEMAEDSLD